MYQEQDKNTNWVGRLYELADQLQIARPSFSFSIVMVPHPTSPGTDIPGYKATSTLFIDGRQTIYNTATPSPSKAEAKRRLAKELVNVLNVASNKTKPVEPMQTKQQIMGSTVVSDTRITHDVRTTQESLSKMKEKMKQFIVDLDNMENRLNQIMLLVEKNCDNDRLNQPSQHAGNIYCRTQPSLHFVILELLKKNPRGMTTEEMVVQASGLKVSKDYYILELIDCLEKSGMVRKTKPRHTNGPTLWHLVYDDRATHF
jgi:hypothetical protein